MKRKIIICAIIAIIIGLVVVGVSTGVLPEKVFPMLKKAAMAVPPKMWIGLLFKFLVLTGLMGYITKTVNARKDRFLNGEVDYRLDNNYSLIVGYDFQVRPLIKRLLSNSPDARVLLITDRNVRAIRAEMNTELSKKEAARLMYMRRDLALPGTYSGLRIRGANAVYLLGDEGAPGRDGIMLQASKIVADKVSSDIKAENNALSRNRQGAVYQSLETPRVPVKVYLQFDDPEFYSQMCSERLPMDPETYPSDYKDEDKRGKVIPETVLFDLEVFNYYDSWVWKCWSEKDSADGSSPYLPLRFKKDAERVELFVIGSGKATKAVVDSAITLMNYGDDTRHCRMTVVSDRSSEILPSDDVINALPELEVIEYSPCDIKGTVAAKMLEAVADKKRAVTIAIVEDAPEKSVRTYMRLPFAVRCCDDVSVLMWMGAQTRSLPDKSLVAGTGDHMPYLRYFGMTDCLPWMDSTRQASGVVVDFFYDLIFNGSKQKDNEGNKKEVWKYPELKDVQLDREHLPYDSPNFLAVALDAWRRGQKSALVKWKEKERWAKWSSMNSSDSFKEKAAAFPDCATNMETRRRALRAEHNRWWSERLLAGWKICAKPMDEDKDTRKKKEKELKSMRRHWDLVPFDKLDDFTKDIDKLCIAAMAQQGFIAGT